MSYVEFNPTSTRDLLQEPPQILETARNRDVTKIKITSVAYALKLLYLGEK